MSEEKRIMYFLGRGSIDGDVRGTHLGKVLTYLKMINDEILDATIYKLSLVLGMNSRYVRENYLKGLMYFGVIKLYQEGHNTRWKWIGETAFNGKISELEQLQPPPKALGKELDKPEGYDEYVGNTRKCKNCKKEIPEDKIFCDENCVREYYAKKGVK